MSKEQSKWITTSVVVVLCLLGGFWLARDIVGSVVKNNRDKGTTIPARPANQFDTPNPASKATPDHASRKAPQLSDLLDALQSVPNERIVRFDNDADYKKFLARLNGKNLRLLGRLDGLRAARVGYDNLDDLDDLLDGAESSSNFLVLIPEIPQVDAQPGAVGFGRATLEWLGITEDNSSWGEGVRIAMLDTGVGTHSAFPKGIREIDLITGDGPPIELHGHGTAVASLLVGNDDVSQGIAPSATLLSIRIGDESGSSNSFLLAEGIVRAVDEGAEVINISMGSYGNSSLVREAVEYANESGVVIVAAAGNDGLDSPAFPAAYDGVIAVGAVDGSGQHLAFSNTGDDLDLGAPGFEIVSAWPDDRFTSFSGTSAAAPIVAGTIAATMSQFNNLTAANASELVIENLNAAGAPGEDPQYGEGIIDVGRVMSSETPGIYDLAVASNWYQPPTGEEVIGSLLVTIENRGTEVTSGATVDISIGNDVFPMTVSRLQPGATQVLTLAVNEPTTTESISINSSLNLNGAQDSKASNNELGGQIILITEGGSVPTPTAATPEGPGTGLRGTQ